MQLAQQKTSKLLSSVFLRPNVQGKTFFQDQTGAWSMETKGSRNTQTPNNDPALARRMGTMVTKHDARLLDRGDELKAISDPRSAYTIAGGQSIGRQIDDVIIAAAAATAYAGETGTISVTNGNIVLITAASPTIARILAVKKALDDYDVDMEDRYFVTNTQILNNMLDVDKIGSSDYNSVKALVRGEIDTWLGFKWIMSTRIGTTNIGIAYHKTGICLGMNEGPYVKTDQRADLSYSWQIYYELNLGAVRLEEHKVVLVQEG
jgi:hypothetical protein